MTRRGTVWIAMSCLMVACLALPRPTSAQYFGRNKVQYRTFAFEILKTEHFDVYYYPEERAAAEIVSRLAERWQARLSRFFAHELNGRQAVILYAVGAHFRQTNAVEGLLGEGIGGVTESIRRRIVLPMSGSLADTDHVLGHELVHAFQFDITGTDARDGAAQAPGILAFPLWFVEGMAEYLSLGSVDAQTAMWLRDAALREELPAIRDLSDPKYFPYRWGHAFWAFIGAKFGDRAVASLIRSAANPKFDLVGLARQLGTDPDALTRDWHEAITLSTVASRDAAPALASVPRAVISHETGGGRYNIGPEISPDGRQVAFFSERDRFSVELFLADVKTGRVERKLLKSATDPHFDSLEFLTSAGSWSPDGRTLVITAIRGGRPVLAFIDARLGRITRERTLSQLDDANNPSFSPDGKSIVLAGNEGGLLDLYVYGIETGVLDRLTNDAFADLEPVFTPDGRAVVFVTERFSTALETLEPGPLRLARLSLETRRIDALAGFLQGKHLSPQVSADGETVTFIADPDGIANLYRMPADGGPIEQITAVPTGIAGITSTSPALSMSTNGRLVFSVFEKDGHAIYTLDESEIVRLVPSEATYASAVLPGRARPGGDVERLLADHARGLPSANIATAGEPYRRDLSLDVIGQPTVSGSVNSVSTSFTGSVSALFSDMLGDRSLGLQAQIGSSLADLGAEAVYVSRKHRWNWAASATVSPNSLGYLARTDDPATGNPVVTTVIERQITRGGFAAAAFPFNTSTRFEVSAGAAQLSFLQDTRVGTYDAVTRQLIDVTNQRIETADPLYLGLARAAFVYDTSYFGATAPVFGTRSRIEIGSTSGSLSYQTLLVDWRRYFMPVRPVTFAVRGLQFGRYGAGSDDDRLLDLYLGYPEFVHGYGVGSFGARECLNLGTGEECDVFRSLIGTRMAVINAEVRAPLKGLLTGEIDYGRIPIDVAAFFDAGVAWTQGSDPRFLGGTRRVVRSVGGSVRVNALGLFAFEVSVARPFDRVDRRLQWQVGIRQGF